MVRVSVGVRQSEYQSEDEAESEVCSFACWVWILLRMGTRAFRKGVRSEWCDVMKVILSAYLVSTKTVSSLSHCFNNSIISILRIIKTQARLRLSITRKLFLSFPGCFRRQFQAWSLFYLIERLSLYDRSFSLTNRKWVVVHSHRTFLFFRIFSFSSSIRR